MQAAVQRAKDIEGKVKWIHVEKKTEVVKALKAASRSAKAVKRDKVTEMEQAEVPLRQAQQKLRAANDVLLKEEAAVKAAAKKVTSISAEVENFSESMTQLESELEAARREREDRAAKLRKLQAEYTASKADYDRAPDTEALKKELSGVDLEAKDARSAVDDLADKEEMIQRKVGVVDRKLRELEGEKTAQDNADAQRARVLEREAPKSMEMRQWVAQETKKGTFRAEVVGPIALHVKPQSPLAAQYLENQVPQRVLHGFLTSHAADRDACMAYVRQKNLAVNVYNLSAGGPPRSSPFDPAAEETLRAAGISGWLDALIDAPPAVRKFLCDFSNMNMCLVGDKTAAQPRNAERIVDALTREKNLNQAIFYTPEAKFAISRSQFGNRKINTTTSSLRPTSGLFNDHRPDPVRVAHVATAMEEAEGSLRKLNAELADVAAELDAAKNTAKRAKAKAEPIRAKIQEVNTLKNKVASRQRRLAEETAAASKDAERLREKEVHTKMVRLVEMRADKFTALAKAQDAHLDLLRDLTAGALDQKRCQEQTADLEAGLATLRAAVRDATAECEDAANAHSREQDLLRKLAAEANKMAPGFAPHPPREEAMQARWDDLPGDEDGLAEELASVSSKLKKMSGDRDAIEEMRKNDERISDVEVNIRDLTDAIASLKDKVATASKDWKPRVQSMAKSVSDKFGSYFSSFNCVGDVALELDESDYEKCALAIRVRPARTKATWEGGGRAGDLLEGGGWVGVWGRYRPPSRLTRRLLRLAPLPPLLPRPCLQVKWRPKEPLHVVSAQRDSGGERSVATMVYLIALQDVNPCPFRVVDEINQAMDPNNERKIFTCITKATEEQHSKTQYFLITPKLLPDLDYGPSTTLLFIYNGCAPRAHAHTRRAREGDVLTQRPHPPPLCALCPGPTWYPANRSSSPSRRRVARSRLSRRLWELDWAPAAEGRGCCHAGRGNHHMACRGACWAVMTVAVGRRRQGHDQALPRVGWTHLRIGRSGIKRLARPLAQLMGGRRRLMGHRGCRGRQPASCRLHVAGARGPHRREHGPSGRPPGPSRPAAWGGGPPV